MSASLLFQAIRWMTNNPESFSCNQLKEFLHALDSVLCNSSLASLIGLEKHTAWVCSIVAAIYHLVSHLKGWKSFPVQVALRKSKDGSPDSVEQACVQVAELVGWLEHAVKEAGIPSFIENTINRVIKGVARFPVVNSFARTPPIMWQMNWMPHAGGHWNTSIPPPPADYLLDRDLLQEYIYRVNLLGGSAFP